MNFFKNIIKKWLDIPTLPTIPRHDLINSIMCEEIQNRSNIVGISEEYVNRIEKNISDIENILGKS